MNTLLVEQLESVDLPCLVVGNEGDLGLVAVRPLVGVAPVGHLTDRDPLGAGPETSVGRIATGHILTFTQSDFIDPHARSAGVFEFERRAHLEIDLLEERPAHTFLERVVDRRFVTEVESVIGVAQEGVDEILGRGISRQDHPALLVTQGKDPDAEASNEEPPHPRGGFVFSPPPCDRCQREHEEPKKHERTQRTAALRLQPGHGLERRHDRFPVEFPRGLVFPGCEEARRGFAAARDLEDEAVLPRREPEPLEVEGRHAAHRRRKGEPDERLGDRDGLALVREKPLLRIRHDESQGPLGKGGILPRDRHIHPRFEEREEIIEDSLLLAGADRIAFHPP